MVVATDPSWSLFWFNAAVFLLMTLVRMRVDVLLPDRCFAPGQWIFRTQAWERDGDFYRDVLRIDRWKDKVPAVDSLNNFSKRQLTGAHADYLQRFVLETCRAESNHLRSVLSVIPLRLWTPPDLWLLCFLLALLGNLPFVLIQRYNRPRLQRTLARIQDRRFLTAEPALDWEPATA